MKEFVISAQDWLSSHITPESLLALGGIILIVVVVTSVFKTLKSLNTTMVFFVFGLMIVGTFFYWVYNRNEPAFMTPVVEFVAGFLPKKDGYQEYQSP